MGYIIGRQVPSHCYEVIEMGCAARGVLAPRQSLTCPIARWAGYLLRLAFLSYCLSTRCVSLRGLSTYCSRLRIGRREGGRSTLG